MTTQQEHPVAKAAPARRTPTAEKGAATKRRQRAFRCGTVAIVGRPSVGKSTLLNAFLKFKLSIVSPKPQTTRHKLLGILNGKGYQAIFLDTPGFMERARDVLDTRMMRRILDAMDEADLVVLLAEPRPPGTVEERIAAELRKRQKTAILVINKIDRVAKPQLLPVIEAYSRLYQFEEIIPISALQQDGVDALLDMVVQHLPRGEAVFGPDDITDRTERFLAAELVREQVFRHYGKEVPYDVAVELESFRERAAEDAGKDYIQATIYVNRPSQKKILVGRDGEALKAVGTEARKAIEELVGRPVFLELWVKVRPGWRRIPGFLEQLGY
ncbi:MAG: GTPase Era [Chloroflexi bacterium]|nr:GTPase Era [Chloroflexota bacterium]